MFVFGSTAVTINASLHKKSDMTRKMEHIL